VYKTYEMSSSRLYFSNMGSRPH